MHDLELYLVIYRRWFQQRITIECTCVQIDIKYILLLTFSTTAGALFLYMDNPCYKNTRVARTNFTIYNSDND